MTPVWMSIMRQCFVVSLVVVGVAHLPTVAVAQGGEVWPKGTPITAPQNTTGNTVTFQVTKTSSGTQELVRFLCGGVSAVTSCTPPAGQFMDSGQTINVNVTFATGLEGVGSVSLTAFGPYFGQDTGWVNVAVVAPAASTTYNLAYDGNGKLDRITDPAGRVLEAAVSGGLLTILKDPSLDSVAYGYDGEERLTTRTDRRGHQTTYRYVNGLRVTSVEIPLSSPTDLAILSFTNWDEGGLVIGVVGGTQTPQDPALVYTQIDGPRTDVPDVMRFWVDRWGAPTRIVRNALGAADTTDLTRGNSDVPALVTQVRAPNGFITQATYDLRGNPLTTTDVNPYGPGSPNAVTSYSWDPTWDFVTKIKRPLLDSVVFAYSGSNGNRLWQQDGRGDSTRVNFNYVNSYSLLSSVVLPGGARDSVVYTGSLGNPFLTRSPLGSVTTGRQDLMGRDTLVEDYQQRQRFIYDGMNRVLQQNTIGLEIIGVAPAETVFVQNFYDKEGDLDSLLRESRPDVASIGRIKTSWVYDFAGRRIKEVAPDGRIDSTAYDPAGNPTTLFTRRKDPTTGARLSIRMTYDTLNRLTTRILDSVSYGQRPSGIDALGGLPTVYAAYRVPVDTQRFSYDIMGRMRTANNTDARVSRAYYSNGLLQTETDSLRTVQGTDFTQHAYRLQFSYDLDGRRTTLGVPSQLDPQGVAAVTLGYDPAWDALTSLTQATDNFSLAYTARGELRSISFPGNLRQAHGYDADGRLVADSLRRQGFIFPRRSIAYTYDPLNRLLSAADPGGFRDTMQMAYSGLGHLVHSMFLEWSNVPLCPNSKYTNDESFSHDPMGNRIQSTSTETVQGSDCSSQTNNGTNSTYGPLGTGRLSSQVVQGFTTSFWYDSSGNTEFSQNLGTPAREQASYYAADGTLRVTDTRDAAQSHNGQWWKRSFDEYRYDAIGRRIWVRSQKSCLPSGSNFVANTECQTSVLRRVIWDGSDILAEIQVPGGSGDGSHWENDVAAVTLPPLSVSGGLGDPSRYFGRVIYAHAVGIDHPTAVTRYNFVRAVDDQGNTISPAEVIPWARFTPFWDVLGDPSINAFTTGEQVYCPGPSNQCEGVFAPYYFSAYDREHGNSGRNNWQGSLLESQQDKSGLQFRRSRYYDPLTGRFTQEDPIGLAGGLNLYGFAAGDPVNFGDPFGLAPCDWHDVSCWYASLKEAGLSGNWFKRFSANSLADFLNDFGLVGFNEDAQGAAEGRTGSKIMMGVTVALALAPAAMEEGRLVIGKMADLTARDALANGERTLLSRLGESLGSPKANWARNAGALRAEMARGLPIRDASVNAITGALENNTGFLRAERNLLLDRGWTYDPGSRLWNPPH